MCGDPLCAQYPSNGSSLTSLRLALALPATQHARLFLFFHSPAGLIGRHTSLWSVWIGKPDWEVFGEAYTNLSTALIAKPCPWCPWQMSSTGWSVNLGLPPLSIHLGIQSMPIPVPQPECSCECWRQSVTSHDGLDWIYGICPRCFSPTFWKPSGLTLSATKRDWVDAGSSLTWAWNRRYCCSIPLHPLWKWWPVGSDLRPYSPEGKSPILCHSSGLAVAWRQDDQWTQEDGTKHCWM